MKPIVTVAERPTGKIPTTAVTNELARAVQGMTPSFSGGQSPPSIISSPFDIWLVWDSGPDEEADPTNHTYWLRRAYLSNTKATPAVMTDPAKLKEITSTPAHQEWILATNLAERPPNTGGTETNGTHALFKGQAVGPVWVEMDDADPSVVRYVFHNAIVGAFPVTLTQTGGSNGNATTAATYTYTVKNIYGTTLATAVGQTRPRPIGSVTAGTIGLAYYEGATLKLWDAGEIPGGAECS